MSDINIGAITEALNDKTDRDMRNVDTGVGADSIVAYQNPTAVNDYTGFVKFASGRLICWGQFSSGGSGNKQVTLPVEMNSTNYAALAIRKSGASTTTGVNVWARDPTTSTTFNVYTSNDTGVNWIAIGIAAS